MAVFGALNRYLSRLDSDPSPQAQGNRGGPCGFQVLRNDSKDVQVEPWFDFIIGINGRQIDNPDPYLFAQEIKNCAGNAVTLTFWTAKGQQTRDLQLPVSAQDPKLGLTLQWTALAATDNVWHILDVIPNSPADQAGLLPYGDYIIGTPEGAVQGESGLGELVEDYMSRPLRLWVYNHEYTVTRPITITPSRSWGGEGALGCVLGFGALHHIPAVLAEPPSGPGDTLFETAKFSNEEPRAAEDAPAQTENSGPAAASSQTFTPSFITPATAIAPPPSVKQPASARAQRKARGGAQANQDFDSMWKESEEKSKEDFTPSAKAAVAPPPPKLPSGSHTPLMEERRETASPAPILDDDEDEGVD